MINGILIAWRPSIRSAIARTVHANPISSNKRESMTGKMIPPSEDPPITIPTAAARRRRNQ